MSNDYFQFRQFIVHQQRCAMKVGTDGTLLGAWAWAPSGRCRILDIGTGTGLIALMMAQRFPESSVLGIDIDSEAVAQATENVQLSPFSERINILQKDLMKFVVDSLECPDDQRTIARHTVSLTNEGLIRQAYRLLKDDGCLSLVIPSESRSLIESAASLEGFFLSRVCLIKTTPRKQPKRQLIEFRKHAAKELVIEEGIIEDSPNVRSAWYQQLTKEFYIK